MSSATFSASNEEDNSFTLLNAPGEKRSMSEIANVARFAEISVHDDVREERVRRIWLPIVERTLHWFAGRESNTRESEHKGFASNV